MRKGFMVVRLGKFSLRFGAWLVLLLSLAAAAGPAVADTLGAIKAKGLIVWGADQEGGAPFVYPSENDKSQIAGFEVDLAAVLAQRLGVKAQFFQGSWDQMPALLETRKVDIVLNGYEWTAPRLEAMAATIPYYVYGLQLLTRDDNETVKTIDDLKTPGPHGKWRVGVLSGSAADDYMRQHFAGSVEVVPYDGNTDAMGDVEIGRLHATLQDTPIVAYYGPKYPRLRKIGAPVGHGYYVIYAHRDDATLVAALNDVLITLIRDGTLERIYRKHGIWDDAQRELLRLADTGRFYGYQRPALAELKPTTPEPTASVTAPAGRTVPGFADSAWLLVEAAGMTVVLAVISFPLASILGLLIAVGRLYGPNWLRPVLVVYVEFLRGTPVLLQLYFIFFFLPVVGINVPAFWTAIAGLAINYSAYESEIYRAGIQAIPRGQMEGALSLGISRWLALRHVVVPQATRIVLPPIINDFIALFKDTSVCSVITLVELTKQFSILSRSDPQSIAYLMGITALLYVLMSYPTSRLARYVEKRLAAAHAR
ncbi:MAG: ABC transporter permease subunit [Alphaproteobacteria bacterium]